MAGTTSPDGIPFPEENDGFEQFFADLEDMADGAQQAVTRRFTQANSAATDARAHAEDAHLLNAGQSVLTADTEIQTGQLDLSGASLTLGAGIGALVLTTFGIRCDVWNGASIFEGRLRVIRLSDGVAVRTEPRPVTYGPGVAAPRNTQTKAYVIPPENYGRGLQLAAIKSSTAAGYTALGGLTGITLLSLRNGVR